MIKAEEIMALALDAAFKTCRIIQPFLVEIIVRSMVFMVYLEGVTWVTDFAEVRFASLAALYWSRKASTLDLFSIPSFIMSVEVTPVCFIRNVSTVLQEVKAAVVRIKAKVLIFMG